MPSNQLEAILLCGCGCGSSGCPCCPGWPQGASGSVAWTSTAVSGDCGGGTQNSTGDFSCEDTEDPIGTPIRSDATFLNVKVKCKVDPDTGSYRWVAEYRSAISGGTFEPPISDTFAEATDTEFSCPNCTNAVNGQATGTVDFVAQMACETSGGIVTYDVLVHGVITIGCP